MLTYLLAFSVMYVDIPYGQTPSTQKANDTPYVQSYHPDINHSPVYYVVIKCMYYDYLLTSFIVAGIQPFKCAFFS